VLGNAGVGKTSLVKKFLTGNFTVSYNPTVEDSYLHNIRINGGMTQCIEILDTSGFYEFPAMRELNIRLSSACILVFDVNDDDSLNNLIELYTIIKQIKSIFFRVTRERFLICFL
jgi:small GTP-binding protein